MSKLVLINEGAGAVEIELKPGSTTVGRSENNAVVIDDEMVSECHCELVLAGREVRVRDLQSTHGTFIDEQRVTDATLRSGGVLRIGNALFRLEAEAAVLPTAGVAAPTQLLTKAREFAFAEKRLPLPIRAGTGLLAGLLVVFVTRALPFYPADWRVLSFLLVTVLWLFWPAVGKFAALAVCFLPLAYFSPLLLAAAGVVLMACQSAPAFLLLGGLCVVLISPGLLFLTLIVPLAAGFLGLRAGPIAAGTGCLMAQIMLRLGLVESQPRVVATARRWPVCCRCKLRFTKTTTGRLVRKDGRMKCFAPFSNNPV